MAAGAVGDTHTRNEHHQDDRQSCCSTGDRGEGSSVERSRALATSTRFINYREIIA